MSSQPTTVAVVEPPIPDRVRRPADLLRLVVAVVVLGVAIGLADAAVGTTGALENDLALATGGLPRVLLQLLGWLSGIGVVVLPVAVGADLIARARPLQLVQAFAAAGVGALIVLGVRSLVLEGHLGPVLGALTRPLSQGRTDPLDAVIVSLVALLTVAGVLGERWISTPAIIIVVSTAITAFISGASTSLAVVCSVLLGWAVGLSFRFGLGAVSTRPPGPQIAQALVAAGVPLTRLELVSPGDRGGRRYRGSTATSPVDVRVMDRDTFGLASWRLLLRRLRLRDGSTRAPALTWRAELEHQALMGLAFAQADIPAPRPIAVCEVGPYCAVIAYVNPSGKTVDRLGDRLDDAQVGQIWRMLATLQRRRVAHRELSPNVVMITQDGRAGLTRVGRGDVAADDLSLRIDSAQLLTTVGLAVGPQRAVAGAMAELGGEAVGRVIPLLQGVAMPRGIRAALKGHADLLGDLRDEIQRRRPSEQAEPMELRRVTPRGVVTVIGGGVAAYVLLTQLAQVNLGQVVGNAAWGWALGAVGCAALTFAGASLALSGAVSQPLPFARTMMTQLAVAFSGLVAPAAIGNLALNTRYLQKAGVAPAIAGASVGVAQVAQFSSYFVLLTVSGVVAGTGPRASFTPPPVLIAAIALVAVVVLGLLVVPRVRRLLMTRVVPQVKLVVPQVLSVLQHPGKLARLLGGALLLDLSFVASMVCATRAFGADAPIAAIAVVYFAGAIIGSAVPTPGGLGGIEAAMSAGLIAIGLPGGTAVSSVLLYRLATYWLPIPFGWYSLNRLLKAQAI